MCFQNIKEWTMTNTWRPSTGIRADAQWATVAQENPSNLITKQFNLFFVSCREERRKTGGQFGMCNLVGCEKFKL